MSARKDIIFPSYMLIDALMYSADNDSYVTGWDRLSPALTLAGTGIADTANATLDARDDTLKRFRVSVAGIQGGTGPTDDILLDLDTANLYFQIKAGSNPPVGGTPSATVGTLVKGLPVKFQKVHFFASQYQGAFKEGPPIDASETSMANDPVEYCCYMLCSSPVRVNRAPHPVSTTLDSSSEGAEQTQTAVDWIPDGDFDGRLTIGGAPLTKIDIITGVEAISGLEGVKLRLKKGYVYGAFPTSNTDIEIPLDTGHDDIYDRLDCICSELGQLTGADGTYLGDCCSTTTTTTTTTTTPTPCDPPALISDKWYCITVYVGEMGEGNSSWLGSDFNSAYSDYCPYTVNSGPFETEGEANAACGL